MTRQLQYHLLVLCLFKGPPAHDFFVTVIGGRDGGCSRLLTPPKDVDICAFPGETVTFTCLLPPRSISSTPVITTPYGVQAPSQFYLSNCHNEINGQYNCSTSNECGASSSTVTVQVYGESYHSASITVSLDLHYGNHCCSCPLICM